MKKYILIFSFVIAAMGAWAQPQIHLGLTTSFNSTFVLDKGLSEDPRYSAKANYEWAPVGFSAGINFGKKFGLSLEAIKAAQGQIYEVVDAYEEVVGERSIDVSYFQFPLMMNMMSGGNGTARFNFQLGPQLSILQSGLETMQYQASTQNLPEGVEPPEGAVQNPDGTWSMPEMPFTTLLSSSAEAEIEKFKNKEVQIALGFGLDIDLSRNLYLSTNVRANYSFTDMRNSDLIEKMKDGSFNDIFSQRANLAVGVQLGVHWMFGGTRSYKAKEKEVMKQLGYN